MLLWYLTIVSKIHNEAGVSLGEIVFALGILAFVALTLVGLFSQLILTSSKNRDQIMAELIANELVERAIVEGPVSATNPAGGWGVGGNTGVVHPYNITEPSTFFYRVDVAQLDTSESDTGPVPGVEPTGDILALGHHWVVTVQVGWNPDDSSNLQGSRVSQGKQWVEVQKNVYFQEWIHETVAP